MGKNKKKVTHTKKEEEQAKRVIKIISVGLVILFITDYVDGFLHNL